MHFKPNAKANLPLWSKAEDRSGIVVRLSELLGAEYRCVHFVLKSSLLGRAIDSVRHLGNSRARFAMHY